MNQFSLVAAGGKSCHEGRGLLRLVVGPDGEGGVESELAGDLVREGLRPLHRRRRVGGGPLICDGGEERVLCVAGREGGSEVSGGARAGLRPFVAEVDERVLFRATGGELLDPRKRGVEVRSGPPGSDAGQRLILRRAGREREGEFDGGLRIGGRQLTGDVLHHLAFALGVGLLCKPRGGGWCVVVGPSAGDELEDAVALAAGREGEGLRGGRGGIAPGPGEEDGFRQAGVGPGDASLVECRECGGGVFVREAAEDGLQGVVARGAGRERLRPREGRGVVGAGPELQHGADGGAAFGGAGELLGEVQSGGGVHTRPAGEE